MALPVIGQHFKSPTQTYRVIQTLSGGGMSYVFLAYRVTDNTPVVIKVTNPDETAKHIVPQGTSQKDIVQMAKDVACWADNEANVLRTAPHARIPKFYESFSEANPTGGEQIRFVVMEYLEGQVLADLIANRLGQSEQFTTILALELLAILEHLHGQKPSPIIYRDIKPENIMMIPAKGQVPPRGAILFDFGILKTQTTSSGHTQAMGTPGYAPPEQVANRATPRSDIYALGCLLSKVLTTKNPPPVPPVPPVQTYRLDVSDDLNVIILKATDVDPTKRYQSAKEMADDIMNIGKPKAPPAPAPKPMKAPTIHFQKPKAPKPRVSLKVWWSGLAKRSNKQLALAAWTWITGWAGKIGSSLRGNTHKTSEVDKVLNFCREILDPTGRPWSDQNLRTEVEELTQFIEDARSDNHPDLRELTVSYFEEIRDRLLVDIVTPLGWQVTLSVAGKPTTLIGQKDAGVVPNEISKMYRLINNHAYIRPNTMGLTVFVPGTTTVWTIWVNIGRRWYAITR